MTATPTNLVKTNIYYLDIPTHISGVACWRASTIIKSGVGWEIATCVLWHYTNAVTASEVCSMNAKFEELIWVA
jgi:hypothetical protein